MTQLDLFQYMIGNADYSVQGRHNMKVLTPKLSMNDIGIPIPYDFDYSGLVDASYAVPGDNLGISSVTQRYFLGSCRSEHDIQEAINGLESKKDQFFKVIDDFKYLDERERSSMKKYLESFFVDVKRKGFYKYSVLTACK